MQIELHAQPGSTDDIDSLRAVTRELITLSHPNLVQVVDIAIDSRGEVTVVTAAATGLALQLAEVKEAHPDPSECCSLIRTAAKGLDHLHREGIRGRMSLSWDDMIRAMRGVDGWRLAVLPPGPGSHSEAIPGAFTGVVRFAAPEQFRPLGGRPTPAADVYALAAMLFELLTGERLALATTIRDIREEALQGKPQARAESWPGLPSGLGAALAEGLRLDSSARPTLGEWSERLGAFGGVTLPPPIEAPEGEVREPRPGERPKVVFKSLSGPKGTRLNIKLPESVIVGGFGGARAALRMAHPGESSQERSIPFAGPASHDGRGVPALGVEGSAVVVPASIAAVAEARSTAIADADPVDCTVFAPPGVAAGSSFLLQVFLHTPDQADDVVELAHEADDSAGRLGFRSLEIDVPRGTRLLVELKVPDCVVEDSFQAVLWRGRATSVQFAIEVPSGCAPGVKLGKVSVLRDDVPVGHVRFKLEVTAAGTMGAAGPTPRGDESKRYERAFISYCSADRDEVLKRVQMLELCHISYFQDVLSLEPGQRWEKGLYQEIDRCDVFMLFWSGAAKASEWVLKEVRYALERKNGNDASPPEIRPVIIEGPPPVLPPPELADLHFNDKILYFIRSAPARPAS